MDREVLCSPPTAAGCRYSHPPCSGTPTAQPSYTNVSLISLQPFSHTNIPQANKRICNHIRNSKPQGWPSRLSHYILEHHDRNTTSESTSHSRKAHEQHHTRLPGHAVTTVTKVVGAQPGLVDRVDYQHTQRGEDARDPVDKVHVEVGAVQGRVGEDSCINQDEERDGELDIGLVAAIEDWLIQ